MDQQMLNLNPIGPVSVKKAKQGFYEFCASKWGFRTAAALAAVLKSVGLAGAQAAGSGSNFCSTNAGQFMGATQGLSTAVVGSTLVILLAVGALLKMLSFRGTSRLGNAAIGAFFVGLVFLIFGGSAIHFANNFTDLNLTKTC